MRRVLPLLALVSLAFAPAPVYRVKPDTKTELEKMQGEWVRISCSLNGDQPIADTGDDTAVYCGDRLSRIHEGMVSARWVVALDPSKEPKWMEIGL